MTQGKGRGAAAVVIAFALALAAASCGNKSGSAGMDRSSPEKLFASFRAAVVAWDTRAIFDCWDVPEERYDDFVQDLTKDKDEIVTCMRNAELGETKEKDDGRVKFGLLNCPSKRGKFTGTMIKKPDGTWRIKRM